MQRIVASITTIEQHLEAITGKPPKRIDRCASRTAGARFAGDTDTMSARPSDAPGRLAQSGADLPLLLRRVSTHLFASAGVRRTVPLG